MLSEVVTIFVGLLTPYLIYYFRDSLQVRFKVDYVILAYALGMLVKFLTQDFFSREILQGFIYISIPLAMPLLIFKADFFSWLKNAPMTVKSFLIACLSTCWVGFMLGKYLLQDEVGKKIIAMLIGVFIGGTPNLNAIGLSLNVPFEVIAIANTVDLMASSLFLLFMLFFAQPLFTKILPYPMIPPKNAYQNSNTNTPEKENTFEKILPLILSIGILGLSVGLSFLMFEELSIPFIMLAITFFGIWGSLNKKIRNFSMSETYGNYLITIFCFSTGLILDITQIFHHIDTLFFASFGLIFISLGVQLIFSRLFKIPANVMMICAVACVMSPAFVPMFVKHFQDDELLLPGITAGLAGFAVGNLLGLGIYALF
ncbi:MAG: hypothetical protein KatS3mg035_0066 [Bacteroidia bacterium]|nr:MAG: hypothetical protein KatS3mg035_0066 [Bacteroidia bacterium]